MRRRDSDGNLVGEDSFLDVIANLVGVLIILVTVVSMQAGVAIRSRDSITEQEQQLSELRSAVWEDERIALSVESDCDVIQDALARQAIENRQLENLRHELLVQFEVVEQEIARRRSELEESSRVALDQAERARRLETEVNRLRAAYARLDQLRDQAESRQDRVELVHYPAPIAKTVFSQEIHFVLSENRLAYVPIDDLLKIMKATWQDQVRTGESLTSIEGVAGPQDGFAMRYQLVAERIQSQDRQGSMIKLAGFEIVPTTDGNGEALPDALASQSAFRSRIDRLAPQKTTVSIWVYPDSFDAFMQLQTWLRERGYQTAGWPLQTGGRISGGPNGLKTTAQ